MSTETKNPNSGQPMDPLNPECVVATCESCGGEYQRPKNGSSKLCRKCRSKLVRMAITTRFDNSSLAKKFVEALLQNEDTPEQ